MTMCESSNTSKGSVVRFQQLRLLLPIWLLLSWQTFTVHGWMTPSSQFSFKDLRSSSTEWHNIRHFCNRRVRVRHCLAMYDDDNHDERSDHEDPIHFDDFGFVIGGDGGDAAFPAAADAQTSSLQQRMTQLVATEEQELQQISQNWKEGHWSVRGCSLDPHKTHDDDESDSSMDNNNNKKIQVSALCAPSFLSDPVVIVGRTDGSLCWLQVGTEYMATFTNRLVAQETSNATIRVQEQLRRQDNDDPSSSSSSSNSNNGMPGSNFEILAQIQATATATPIEGLVTLTESSYLYVLSHSSTGMGSTVQQFFLGEDEDISSAATSTNLLKPLFLPTTDTTTSKIVAMKAYQDQYLVLVHEDGQVSVWQPPMGDTSATPPTLVHSWQLDLEDREYILSLALDDDDYIYLGTSQGRIFVYGWQQQQQQQQASSSSSSEEQVSQNEPLKVWEAFANAGVSSLAYMGPGSMGGSTLVAGSSTGELKQWEVFSRGESGMVEYWPKLSSQKLPGKVHLLGSSSSSSGSSGSSSSESVLGVYPVGTDQQQSVLLAATPTDWTLWNTETGHKIASLTGFENLLPSCQVIQQSLLVTNGMQEYLCVHDFSIDPNIDLDDMIHPFDSDTD